MRPEDWQLKHMLWEISDRMFVFEEFGNENTIWLSKRDQEAVLNALENPPKMAPAMKRAMEIAEAAREVERMRGTR